MKSLLFALPSVLLFAGVAIAAPKYAADVTGVAATPAARVAPKGRCPVPKNAPARGVAAARRECVARSARQSGGFTPDPNAAPVVSNGSGTR